MSIDVKEFYAGMDTTYPFGNDSIGVDEHTEYAQFNTVVTNRVFTPDNDSVPEDLQIRVSDKLKFYVGSNDAASNVDYSLQLADTTDRTIIDTSKSILNLNADFLELNNLTLNQSASTVKISTDKMLQIHSANKTQMIGQVEFKDDISSEKNVYVGESLIFQQSAYGGASNDQVRIALQYNQQKDTLDIVKQQGTGDDAAKRLMARFGVGAVAGNTAELNDVPFHETSPLSASFTTNAAVFNASNVWKDSNQTTLYYAENVGENVGIGLSSVNSIYKFQVVGNTAINGIEITNENISQVDRFTANELHTPTILCSDTLTVQSNAVLEQVEVANINFKNNGLVNSFQGNLSSLNNDAGFVTNKLQDGVVDSKWRFHENGSGQLLVQYYNGSSWVDKFSFNADDAIGASAILSYMWTKVFEVEGDNANDLLGHSTAISGDGLTVAIGAGDILGRAGNYVMIFRKNNWEGGLWEQLGSKIEVGSGTCFGYSVALSGDGSHVIIGDIDNSTYNSGTNSDGHARVYEWSEGAWVQLGATIDGEAAGDLSGWSVAMSSDGSRIAIGAVRNGGNPGGSFYTGHVRVFDWSGSAWNQVGLDLDGELTGEFGWSVAMSQDGSRIIAGGPQRDPSKSGYARVYEHVLGTWTQVGADILGGVSDTLGTSVSISSDGSRIAVGATQENVGAGFVNVYDLVDGTWTQVGDPIVGEVLSKFGFKVSLTADGSRLAASALNAVDTNGNPQSVGKVRVFDWDGSAWIQVGEHIDGFNPPSGQTVYLGEGLSMSGDGTRFVVGAPEHHGGTYGDRTGWSKSSCGISYVFDWLPEP